MVHLEVEVNKGRLVLERVISYIHSEDCFILTYFPKDSNTGKPLKIFSSLKDAKEYIKDERNCLLC